MDEINDAWSDAIDQFETHLINLGRSERTQELRRTYLEKFARGRTDAPADVLPRDVSKFVGRVDWSSATRQVAADSMRGFFRWAKKHNLTTDDPTADLARPKVTHKKATPATRKQINDAINNAKKPRDRLMLELNADAGLSAIEISQVRRRDLKKVGNEYTLRVFGKASVEQTLIVPRSIGERIDASTTEYVFHGRKGIGHLAPAYIVKRISAALPDDLTSESVRAHRTVARGGSWRELRHIHDPAELDFMATLSAADSEELEQYIVRIDRDLDHDPAAAMGACKELVEGLFGRVLDSRGVVYKEEGKRHMYLPELFDLVADTLGLPTKTTAGSTSGGVRAIVRGLATTVEGITRVRNDVGTGHAHTEAKAETLHARLVFNATVTICEFLAVEWQRQDSA